ncbi:MAG TPA: adenylate/guanylate cyclase domain-containing protein [Gaiellaceae bacterium]|nr:adenylate/guanylate cyclase domain-containing protein [Gaiellaceae bacterium]
MNDQPHVLTFLIADVRGYSRYTEEYGDEAAAKLAAKFVDLVAEGVEVHGGTLIEVRGDEGLAVFTSARQAIRAAVELQAQFAEETDAEADLPLRVGIGIDSGEAVQLEDGSYRGAALNVAARLCGRAHAGEVIVSAGTSRLAGRLAGLQFSDRGRVHLKNIPEPLHIFQVYSEKDTPPARRPVRTFLSKPGRGLGWRLGLAVVVIAAGTAATVAYLTTGGGAEPGSASPTTTTETGGGTRTGSAIEVALARDAGLDAIVPSAIWEDCRLQTVAEPAALQTAACIPADGMPDRWEISSYADGGDLAAAYEAELRRREEVTRDSGRCNAFVWGGERQWLHGADKPGGRTFCYFDGNDAVIVWTHQRLGQPTHRDVLVIAREGGSDHVGLTRWWRPWHHLIGKSQ